jgi:hypothetical protein
VEIMAEDSAMNVLAPLLPVADAEGDEEDAMTAAAVGTWMFEAVTR